MFLSFIICNILSCNVTVCNKKEQRVVVWVVEIIYKVKYFILCRKKNRGKAKSTRKTQGIMS